MSLGSLPGNRRSPGALRALIGRELKPSQQAFVVREAHSRARHRDIKLMSGRLYRYRNGRPDGRHRGMLGPPVETQRVEVICTQFGTMTSSDRVREVSHERCHPHPVADQSGDPSAAEQLLPLVYEELRKLAAVKLAHEKPGQTLQATALVHEAYLRLVDVETDQHWDSRGHFFAAAAEAMRRILVDSARRQESSQKRGGDMRRASISISSHLPLAEP